MTTSANVTHYRILKDGEVVGNHRQNALCKTSWDELYKYAPVDAHEIQILRPDENEVVQNLGIRPLDKYLKELANAGINKLKDNGEMYYWENEHNHKQSQKFAWEHEAVMAYHCGLLQWN